MHSIIDTTQEHNTLSVSVVENISEPIIGDADLMTLEVTSTALNVTDFFIDVVRYE